MHASLAIISCFLTLTVASPDYCPKPADLAPCTCDEEGFNCRNAKDENAIRKAMTSWSVEDTAREMYIQGTSIKRLSKDTFGRFKFAQFHIDVNEITEVESGAFRGSRDIIIAISLFRNELEKFPFKDVEDLPKLTALSLKNNKLTTIPGPMAFGRQTVLNFIDLSYNSISRIERDAFNGLSNLHKLDLQGNKLMALESLVFNIVIDHPYLEIALNNNSIGTVAPDAFGSSTPREIDLSYNRLTYLPEIPFKNLIMDAKSAWPQIVVEGNPLTCQGCSQYRWIVQNNNNLRALIGFTCNNKQNVSALTLQNIGCVDY